MLVGRSLLGLSLPGLSKISRRKLVLAALIAVAPASAGTAGRISGTVKDSAGAPLARVKVTAVSAGTGVKTGVTTNKDGVYGFLNVQPGIYTVAAEAAGFKPLSKPGIVVHVDSVVQTDLILEPDAPASK